MTLNVHAWEYQDVSQMLPVRTYSWCVSSKPLLFFHPHMHFVSLPSSWISISQTCSVARLRVRSDLSFFLNHRGSDMDNRPVPQRGIKPCHRPLLPLSLTYSITLTAGPSLPKLKPNTWQTAERQTGNPFLKCSTCYFGYKLQCSAVCIPT